MSSDVENSDNLICQCGNPTSFIGTTCSTTLGPRDFLMFFNIIQIIITNYTASASCM